MIACRGDMPVLLSYLTILNILVIRSVSYNASDKIFLNQIIWRKILTDQKKWNLESNLIMILG